MTEEISGPILIKAPSSGFLLRGAIWIGLVALLIYFLVTIRLTLTIFGLGWFIAYLLNPIVKRLEGHRLGPIRRCSRATVVLVIYFLFAVLFIVASSFILPEVAEQLTRLADLQKTLYNPVALSKIIQTQGERLLQLVPQSYRQPLMTRLSDSLGMITTQLGTWVANGLSYLASFFGQLIAGAFIFLSSTIISIYMLLNWRGIGHAVVGIFPEEYKKDIHGLLREMNAIFGGYMRATILTSLACSVTTLICLVLFSTISGRACPYAYLISFIAGITYPIPILGILATTVIGAVLGYIPEADIVTGFWVGAIVLVMNNILDRTLQPIMMSDAIGVSPLFVIFAAAAGGEFLGGVWGMLLGIPIAAMAKVLFIWIYERFLRVAKKEENRIMIAGSAYPSERAVISRSGAAAADEPSERPDAL